MSPASTRRAVRCLPAATCVVALLAAAAPGPLAAQNAAPRAEPPGVPGAGELRIEFSPHFQDWSDLFTEPGSPAGREPHASRWDGPVVDRLFPGPEPLLADLNADAGALGFDPLEPGAADLGALEFRELATEMRTLPLHVELGLVDDLGPVRRMAVNFTVPVVRSSVEPFFDFDPSSATLAPAPSVLLFDTDFFDQVQAVRGTLEGMLEDGDLDENEEEQAMVLLAASGAFTAALADRHARSALVPTGESAAGSQLLAHYLELVQGFQDFELQLPSLDLAGGEEAATLAGLAGDVLESFPLEATVRQFDLSELEVGLRIGLVERRGDDGALGLRTTVGARVRLPLEDPDRSPFHVPSDLLGQPVGDASTDVELSVYQGLELGRLEVEAVGRYGFRQSDRLTMRVRSPDRPLALPDQELELVREPGDYFVIRAAPRLVLNEFLSLGAEYRLWHVGMTRFRVAGGQGDAAPLEIGTGGTRHRLGVGAVFRPLGEDEAGDRSGLEVGFFHQGPVAGSGARIPAATLTSFHVRVPVSLY